MSPDGAEGKTFLVPELTLDPKKAGALGTRWYSSLPYTLDSRDIRLVLMMGSPVCSRPPVTTIPASPMHPAASVSHAVCWETHGFICCTCHSSAVS